MKLKAFLRTLRIIQVFLAHFVFHPLNSHRGESFGRRLRKACQALGVVFIKIGQFLSGRYDMFREEDLTELRQLLDETEHIPDGDAFRIMKAELGADAERLHNLVFLACASIAQVYAGLLDEKERVVVKVVRPGIREQAELDLAILYRLACVIELFVPVCRRLKISQVVSDLRDWIRAETDLSIELRNMDRFKFQLASNFSHGRVRADLGKIVIPKTYPALSTSSVLVMERLNGVTVSDWMRGKRPESGMSYDAPTSILTFMVGSFAPLMTGKDYLFHGDPNPANIVILEHGNLGLIDFGLMGDYEARIAKAFNSMVFAAYLKNGPFFAKALLRFIGGGEKDYVAILPDVEAYVEDAFDKPFGEMLKGSLQLLMKHRLPAPATLSIIVKMNLLSDSLAYEFFPGQSTADLLGKEFETGILLHIGGNLGQAKPANTLLSIAYALSELVAAGPSAVSKVFKGVA